MEEDVKSKFVKWSLKKAKADELDVQAAKDFLNTELLNTLEANLWRPLARYVNVHLTAPKISALVSAGEHACRVQDQNSNQLFHDLALDAGGEHL